MTIHHKNINTRLSSEDGFAIGPILFIIAVLGILAAAISAGSGSFSNSTTSEANNTKTAALMDIGQGMKVAFDRVMGENTGTAINAVNLSTADLNDALGVFSPIGGGASPPPTTMSVNSGTGTWYFPLLDLTALGVGTSAGSRVAMIQVDPTVCTTLNTKANGQTLATPSTAIPDITAAATNPGTTIVAIATTAWGISGAMSGCVQEKTATGSLAAGYYFFQVLGF